MTAALTPIGSIDPVGWVILLGSVAAGVGTVALIWYLRRHRRAPGATWLVATLGAQLLWIAAYTGGLVVTSPLWRASAEALSWVGIALLGPLFLAFALAYTGRGSLVDSRWFRVAFVVPAATVPLAATHPFHSLLWHGFDVVPVFGLVGARYAIQPWGYVAVVASLAAAGAGVLLLVGTVVSYGPLYRREAIAVALSTVPPAAAAVVWLAGVGPWPSINFAGVLFLPHVLLDAYAFVGTHMFDTNPTTQRAAERGALSDLDDPLLVVDPDGRVVNMNARARRLFDAGHVRLPRPVAALVGADVDALRAADEFEPEGRDAVYAVSYTPLTDPGGSEVGAILVFYDITTVRRQKQRLSVLNRVLRHNLRNQLNVVEGRAELIEAEATDPSVRTHAAAIRTANGRLLSIGERIRDFQRVQDGGVSVSTVDSVALVERVVEAVTESHPAATVEVTVDTDQTRIETDEEVLSLALTNLVENAVGHAAEAPFAEIRISDDGGEKAVFEVRDRNDRIPDIEVDAIDADEESALEHGEGIGLWIVTWCLELVDGDLAFAYEDGNVVAVAVPRTDPATAPTP